MEHVTKYVTRKIIVSAPVLNQCPSCGEECDLRNEEGKMKCPTCEYHAGGDLSEAWIALCEDLITSAPAGIELGTCHQSEAPGDEDWIEVEDGAASAINRWIAGRDELTELKYEFDYGALENELVAAGATPCEAGKLTDILAEEGWGGREFEDEMPFARMIDWYREARA